MPRSTVIVRMDSEDHAALKAMAREHGLTMVALLHEAVEQVRPASAAASISERRAERYDALERTMDEIEQTIGSHEDRLGSLEASVGRIEEMAMRGA